MPKFYVSIGQLRFIVTATGPECAAVGAVVAMAERLDPVSESTIYIAEHGFPRDDDAYDYWIYPTAEALRIAVATATQAFLDDPVSLPCESEKMSKKKLPSVNAPDTNDTATAVAVAEAPPAVPDSVATAAQSRRELLATAAEAVEQIASGDRQVDEDCSILFDALGWDAHRVRREIGQAEQRLRWRAIAGTDQELQQAVDARDKLAESTPEQAETLREKIAKLQTELDELESELKAAEAKVQRMEEARENLREHIPKHVQDLHRGEFQRLNNGLGEEIRQFENELSVLKAVKNFGRTVVWPQPQGGERGNSDRIIGHLQMISQGIPGEPTPPPHPALLTRTKGNIDEYGINETEWEAYHDRTVENLEAGEKELAELKRKFEVAKSAIDEKYFGLYLKG